MFRNIPVAIDGSPDSDEEKPMEFLVEFEVNVPDGAPASEVEVRKERTATAASSP